MEIKYGAEVVDRNGKLLGTVNHLMRNTLTGEITKFIVNRKAPASDLFITHDDVLEATETRIRLKTASDETGENG